MFLPSIPPIDEAARLAARLRQTTLTKPERSLGRLEELALELAAITAQARPSVERKALIIIAADHGVTEEGVSAYPSEVTQQMVLNFLRGGAAINVLARQAGARLVIVNAGVRVPLQFVASVEQTQAPTIRVIDSPVANGTANMAQGPAMTQAQVESAINLGIETVGTEIQQGLDLVGTGDMGIGNTTASSAVVAALTGKRVRDVTGRGTGLDDQGLLKKTAAIERALEVNHPDPRHPLEVLRKVGGLEIAGLVGVILRAAAARVPVVLDGFITGAAALVASELVPGVKPFLIAAHQSVEPGHRVILERLGLRPLLDLDLRLGEGTGAALAFHVIEAAARLHNEMATFEEAGVCGKKGSPGARAPKP